MDRNIGSEKAKQGKWGSPVLLVLIGGLLLAGIAWGIAEMFGEATEPTPALESTTNPY
jgi:hypothetical protein